MREHFEKQTELGLELIGDVDLSMRSRDQLPKLLAGLQYIFITEEVNGQVFELLEKKIYSPSNHTGRPGMTLWEIFVLGALRLSLNIDYDRLQFMANYNVKVRGILGVNRLNDNWKPGKEYKLQTIKDNVGLLDEGTLKKINLLIVKTGHQLKKKEEKTGKLPLDLKTDSFVVESDIHFPTDFNLLWDGVRKSLDYVGHLKKRVGVTGFRKLGYWRRKAYSAYRQSAGIHRKKGRDYPSRLEKSTTKYLKISNKILKQVQIVLADLKGKVGAKEAILYESLQKSYDFAVKYMDLLKRRVILGEKIPHSEKVFSLFEQHVEWVKKGKANNLAELGHPVSVTTDQWGSIVDWEVVEGQVDKQLAVALGRRLKENYGATHHLRRISFDRGYYSLLGKQSLQKIFEIVVMPKPGNKTGGQQLEEENPVFKEACRKHSAIESNINELEQSGADKVPDKGIDGFKKYVGWSVLAHNLKRLGCLVMEQQALPTVKRYGKAA